MRKAAFLHALARIVLKDEGEKLMIGISRVNQCKTGLDLGWAA
jgi:hypothetical protein